MGGGDFGEIQEMIKWENLKQILMITVFLNKEMNLKSVQICC